eukprot:scaffold10100_cov136-Isochrysis_galbana.AAC.4
MVRAPVSHITPLARPPQAPARLWPVATAMHPSFTPISQPIVTTAAVHGGMTTRNHRAPPRDPPTPISCCTTTERPPPPSRTKSELSLTRGGAEFSSNPSSGFSGCRPSPGAEQEPFLGAVFRPPPGSMFSPGSAWVGPAPPHSRATGGSI